MYMDSGYTFGVCIENGFYDEKFVNITLRKSWKEGLLSKKSYEQMRLQ